MMNLLHLTDTELLDYLDKFSDDPLILRLVRMQTPYAEVLDDLVRAGANDDFQFDNCYSPSEYIHHLENEIEYLSCELAESQKEVAKLQARTVLEIMAELKNDIEATNNEVRRARLDVGKALQERDEALKKLKMWTTLCERPVVYDHNF